MPDHLLFRLATADDLDAVAAIYEQVHDAEERGLASIGWVRGVYPTRATAEAALEAGELYVAVDADSESPDNGRVVASARINQRQEESYRRGAWGLAIPDEDVLVLHTLTVSPGVVGRGVGSGFVAFYERLARERGCKALRIDTNERNAKARRLYARLGFTEVGVVPCEFNGIPGVNLVLLEKVLC